MAEQRSLLNPPHPYVRDTEKYPRQPRISLGDEALDAAAQAAAEPNGYCRECLEQAQAHYWSIANEADKAVERAKDALRAAVVRALQTNDPADIEAMEAADLRVDVLLAQASAAWRDVAVVNNLLRECA